MQIERVDVFPRKESYNPGEVINIAIYFQSPFNGQCSVGLVPKGYPVSLDFERKTFAKSSATLYEGQLYIRDKHLGPCVLQAVLAPVKGEPRTVAVGTQIFEVQPLVPISRSPSRS